MKTEIVRVQSGWVLRYTTRNGLTGARWARTYDDAEAQRTEVLAMSAAGLL